MIFWLIQIGYEENWKKNFKKKNKTDKLHLNLRNRDLDVVGTLIQSTLCLSQERYLVVE